MGTLSGGAPDLKRRPSIDVTVVKRLVQDELKEMQEKISTLESTMKEQAKQRDAKIEELELKVAELEKNRSSSVPDGRSGGDSPTVLPGRGRMTRIDSGASAATIMSSFTTLVKDLRKNNLIRDKTFNKILVGKEREKEINEKNRCCQVVRKAIDLAAFCILDFGVSFWHSVVNTNLETKDIGHNCRIHEHWLQVIQEIAGDDVAARAGHDILGPGTGPFTYDDCVAATSNSDNSMNALLWGVGISVASVVVANCVGCLASRCARGSEKTYSSSLWERVKKYCRCGTPRDDSDDRDPPRAESPTVQRDTTLDVGGTGELSG